jgi:hypothetical protein
MAIYRLLQQSAFNQEDIDRMAKAYEACLHALGVENRSDPITEEVARLVIEIAQTGERDPAAISRLALKACR